MSELVAAVEQQIRAQLDCSHIEVEMQGNHCQVLVVSEAFDAMSRVQRQQAVYGCVDAQISSGEIHAIHIKALTPAQWQSQS